MEKLLRASTRFVVSVLLLQVLAVCCCAVAAAAQDELGFSHSIRGKSLRMHVTYGQHVQPSGSGTAVQITRSGGHPNHHTCICC